MSIALSVLIMSYFFFPEMSHKFAKFNIPRNLASPEKSRPNGHKGAVNTGKPHEKNDPDSDLLSRPNGIRY